jgi:predicted phage terminase large subunit-like protein
MPTAKQRAKLQPSEVGARAERMLGGGRPGQPSLTKSARIERGRKDFEWFCEYYLGAYFKSAPALFHAELAELIRRKKRVVCAAPREHAKSTVVSFAIVLWWIVYDQRKFIVIFRESDGVASQILGDLREELESNDLLREDFAEATGQGRKWTESEFVTSNDVKVLGRGRGASSRGLRHKQFRPDAIICDDIEDDESVQSKDQREKVMRWFKRVVSNLVAPEGSIFVIGTVLHHDALLVNLLKETEVYETRIWKAITSKGVPLWPARWPMVRLDAKRKEIGARNFATEFMNEAANEEEQIFSPNFWRRYKDDDLAGLKLNVYAAIDPAIGTKARNDDTGVAVVAEHDGRYYVLRVKLGKLKVQQQVELVFVTYRQFPNILKFGFEGIAYQTALKQLVEERSRREALQLPAVAVEDLTTDKLRRLSTLAPLAEQGLIYWPSASSDRWTPDIEKCMEQFEALGCSGDAHDDGPDAVQRAIALGRGRMNRPGRAYLS